MNRPLGVTILALFYLLGAVLFLLVLVVAILQPASLSGLHNPNLRQDIEHARTYQGAHALLILIFAAIGLGLWFLQSWARWTVLVIAGADLARRAVTVVLFTIVHLAGFHRTPGTFFWFATAISAAMYFYLRQQHVKRAFNERHLLIGTEH